MRWEMINRFMHKLPITREKMTKFHLAFHAVIAKNNFN